MKVPCKNNLSGTIRFVLRGAQLLCGRGGLTGHECFPAGVSGPGAGGSRACHLCPCNAASTTCRIRKHHCFQKLCGSVIPVRGNVRRSSDTQLSTTGARNYPNCRSQ